MLLQRVSEFFQVVVTFEPIFQVLHPDLGLAWFQKISPERAEHMRILLEFVFDTYKRTADAKVQSSPPATQPRKPTQPARSFLHTV
jgi:hypothetical protein